MREETQENKHATQRTWPAASAMAANACGSSCPSASTGAGSAASIVALPDVGRCARQAWVVVACSKEKITGSDVQYIRSIVSASTTVTAVSSKTRSYQGGVGEREEGEGG